MLRTATFSIRRKEDGRYVQRYDQTSFAQTLSSTFYDLLITGHACLYFRFNFFLVALLSPLLMFYLLFVFLAL